MEFGIEKCAALVMKRGKLVRSEGIVIPGERLIRAMNDGDVDTYKYLGVLEGLKKEYFRRVQKILKSKLNGGNMVQAINCRAVTVVRYAAGIVEWYVESCNGPWLEAVYKEEVLRCYAKSYEAALLQQERKERFQEKQLHGQFWRNTAEIRDKKTWEWLKKGRLKKETEGMIMAAQDQALMN